MTSWQLLFDLLLLLTAALLMATLAERVRQSAILGYLVAGTIVGPNVLGFVGQGEEVRVIAELGVALLLFATGLEFSFGRLRRLGRVALLGGSVQVLVTLGVTTLVASGLGLGYRAALAVGAMVALSSTAAVLRLLAERAEVDSVHGRNAVGILLMQDLAVIPLMLMVVLMTEGGTLGGAAMALGRTVLLSALLIGIFYLLFTVVVPRVLNLQAWTRNRELPILLAVVVALGSAYAAHAVSLSPAMGAFVAGVLLGESPFATQIRADVSSLRTLLMTVFFTSIGMFGDPAWVLAAWPAVLAAVVAIVLGKSLIVWLTLRGLGASHGVALASGLCLGQIGEFSFVLADVAYGAQPIIDGWLFNLIVSTTIVTLFVTPLLVAAAPRVAGRVESLRRRRAPSGSRAAGGVQEDPLRRDVVIIGFGPAGQAVAGALHETHRERITVIELSPGSAAVARRSGLWVQVGDATNADVLEHAGLRHARVVAITIPDPAAVASVVRTCRAMAPRAVIVARARYHIRRRDIELAGASYVVDEEANVGARVAAHVRLQLVAGPEPPPAAGD